MKRTYVTAAVIGAFVLGLVLASAGPTVAGKLITGKDIKNGSIALSDLSPAVQALLAKATGKGEPGPPGPPGPSGPPGPAGPAATSGTASGGSAIVFTDRTDRTRVNTGGYDTIEYLDLPESKQYWVQFTGEAGTPDADGTRVACYLRRTDGVRIGESDRLVSLTLKDDATVITTDALVQGPGRTSVACYANHGVDIRVHSMVGITADKVTRQ